LQELSRRANGEISRGKSCSELRLAVLPELATHRVESNDEVSRASGLTVPWTALDTIGDFRGVGPARLALLLTALNTHERIDALCSTVISYEKIARSQIAYRFTINIACNNRDSNQVDRRRESRFGGRLWRNPNGYATTE
jgi:hypothetical protein